ncbi:hypothetical protein F4825DRAFT_446104 [Nemania diffusa]|nr:hypothetical protein F4825DRAFT_446104 [Nemania diffusa]
MLYPFTITPTIPPLLSAELCSQPSLVLRNIGQVEDGWRMSHSRDRLEQNLQVAMQVYRPKKRMEAQFDRRDGRKATVICALSASQEDSIEAEGDVGRGIDRPEVERWEFGPDLEGGGGFHRAQRSRKRGIDRGGGQEGEKGHADGG